MPQFFFLSKFCSHKTFLFLKYVSHFFQKIFPKSFFSTHIFSPIFFLHFFPQFFLSNLFSSKYLLLTIFVLIFFFSIFSSPSVSTTANLCSSDGSHDFLTESNANSRIHQKLIGQQLRSFATRNFRNSENSTRLYSFY